MGKIKEDSWQWILTLKVLENFKIIVLINSPGIFSLKLDISNDVMNNKIRIQIRYFLWLVKIFQFCVDTMKVYIMVLLGKVSKNQKKIFFSITTHPT